MQQSELIEHLSHPEIYGLPVSEKIERFDTHISVVFGAGKYAYKLKRAIALPFVDFRKLEDRLTYCTKELEVNEQSAKGLYLDVVPVTQDANGSLAVQGEGQVVDWLVKMHRFDQAELFENRKDIQASEMEALVDHVVKCYKGAKVDQNYGGLEGMERAFEGHYKALANCPERLFDNLKLSSLKEQVSRHIEAHKKLLKERQENGFVRLCHGDLHLRNITRYENRVLVFDAIEFEPDFAVIDVLYDLSFLLMDLCHRNYNALANAVLNRYLGLTGDMAGLNVLPLFLSSRATIRTHVNGIAAQNQQTCQERQEMELDAKLYLDEALDYLRPQRPLLIALGGYSGSGKSVLAKGLAPRLGDKVGAFIARTDMIRKRLMNVKPEEKLSQAGYSADVTKRTYETLYEDVRTALKAGYCVIVDGVFAREIERNQIEQIANELSVDFLGLWLEVDQSILKERVRKRVNDVSDADEKIVEMQFSYEIGDLEWHRLDAGQDIETVCENARELVQDKLDYFYE